MHKDSRIEEEKMEYIWGVKETVREWEGGSQVMKKLEKVRKKLRGN